MINSYEDRGFSLIEVLLSAAMLLLLTTGIVSALFYGTEGTVLSGKRNQANALAEEGLEAVRAIRDEDYDAFTAIPDGTYGIQSTGGTWSLAGSSDTTGSFTRSIEISTVDSSRRDVEATISWQQNLQRTGELSLATRLTNWRNSQQGAIRATEYVVSSGFTDQDYTITLNQDLMPNYFVIIRGAEGNDTNGSNYGPDATYARLLSDPFGTGDLTTSAASNRLVLRRGSNGGSQDWRGVVTVVECLGDCSNAGFQLRGVSSVTHSNNNVVGSETLNGTSWSDSTKVLLMGGYRGAGCQTAQASNTGYPVCFARIFPVGTNQISWTRDNSAGTLTTAISTVMAVEWGSEWNVQRRTVTGTNGGNGVNDVTEYSTSVITPVVRANTWVWGTGHTNSRGIGDSSEAAVITLGNGVAVNNSESLLAVGMEYTRSKNYEVYAISHPELSVEYEFKPDGHSSSLTYAAAMNNSTSAGARFAQIYNGQNGTGTAFTRPVFSARFTAGNTITAQRRRHGQNWPAWIFGVNTAGIAQNPVDTTPPSAISNLDANSPTTSSINLSWAAPGDDASVGTATSYDVRYSTSAITDANWALATQVSGEPAPAVAGTTQSMTVTGLAANTQYYFAIKATDEASNVSNISNNASRSTSGTMATNFVSTNSGAYRTGKDIRGFGIQNTGTSSIIIDRMQISWVGGFISSYSGIRLGGSGVYGPGGGSDVPSGTNVDISDYALAPGASTSDNRISFNTSPLLSLITIVFVFSDGSSSSLVVSG